MCWIGWKSVAENRHRANPQRKGGRMGVDDLDKVFSPESVAVIGASERKGSIGAAAMRNLTGIVGYR